MKVLFLDIDGVLRTDSENADNDFNLKCCEALNDIIRETGCQIVLSADRRLFMTFNELDKVFKDHEIISSPIAKTGHFPATAMNLEEKRGQEINEYVSHHKKEIKKWCAVDDMNLKPFVENFVKTKFNIGLKEPEVIKQIIDKLK
jgi:uncharacterized FAD-dependent dehydrogenase